MKKITFLIALLTTTSLFAQELVMTVSVPPGTTSCRFSGAFWGWDPNGGPVGVDNGNNTFTFTLNPAPSADMEYLYTINGSGSYENLIDNAQNAECTDRNNNGNFNTDFSTFANRVWKTTDSLIWNEIYDDCSEATLSINSVDAFDLKIYPNPTTDIWNISNSKRLISSIQIYDVLGKRVMSLSPNRKEAFIDGTNLVSGLYFAQIKTTSGTNSIKLIKQ